MNPDRWFWFISVVAFSAALYFLWVFFDFVREKDKPGKISHSLYAGIIWFSTASLWPMATLTAKATGRTINWGMGDVVVILGAGVFLAVFLFEKGWSRLDPLPVAVRAVVYVFLGIWIWTVDKLLGRLIGV